MMREKLIDALSLDIDLLDVLFTQASSAVQDLSVARECERAVRRT
jgi:hypothetical protein